MSITYGEMRTEEEVEIDEVILERVKRGIDFLQRQHGDGWVEKINLETLDLASCDRCVLGQVYRDNPQRNFGFTYARFAYPELYNKTAEYGFDIPLSDVENASSYWDNLKSAWVQVLTPRVLKNEESDG